ncbi:dephospho-CoA kinase [Rhodoferax antarcticus]|uniref:dephospho-CoA kinase n=1 Tax=Rhodoferax antarcticus TaxID=81479 RepID=UPI002224C3DB|nr:dephospho-CoA kinase [Rhodoferax antarcticus]MCW2311965.1 dephospho-CoA kinase [Rhodoferax antarcticus]
MAGVLRLGLTGGIGSGKSTVAALLAHLGAAVMDADAIARSVTAPGGPAIPLIRHTFGDEMITVEGALNRDRMRSLAFADASARKRLEAIIHPLVEQETWHQADAGAAAGHRCLVFDVPLLVESAHWRAKVDAVLVVDCTVPTQIQRVMARSQLDASAVQTIIAAQSPRLRRLQAADAVVFNDSMSLQVLRAEVDKLAARFGLSLTANPDRLHQA